ALRAFKTGSGHLSPLVSRVAGSPIAASTEFIALGKALDDAATGRALAQPLAKIGLGARAVLALLPAEPLGLREDLGVGEDAIVIAMQDDAEAERHLRHVGEREDEQLA